MRSPAEIPVKREEPSFSQESGTQFPWDVGRDFQEAVRRMHLGTELRVHVSIYMGSLLLILQLPICLPLAVLSFWSPFNGLSPVVPTQSGEALHTHFEWEGGRSQGIRKSQKQHSLFHKPSDQQLPLHCEGSGRLHQQAGGTGEEGCDTSRQVTLTLSSGREACFFSGSTWLSHVEAGPSCGSRF